MRIERIHRGSDWSPPCGSLSGGQVVSPRVGSSIFFPQLLLDLVAMGKPDIDDYVQLTAEMYLALTGSGPPLRTGVVRAVPSSDAPEQNYLIDILPSGGYKVKLTKIVLRALLEAGVFGVVPRPPQQPAPDGTSPPAAHASGPGPAPADPRRSVPLGFVPPPPAPRASDRPEPPASSTHVPRSPASGGAAGGGTGPGMPAAASGGSASSQSGGGANMRGILHEQLRVLERKLGQTELLYQQEKMKAKNFMRNLQAEQEGADYLRGELKKAKDKVDEAEGEVRRVRVQMVAAEEAADAARHEARQARDAVADKNDEVQRLVRELGRAHSRQAHDEVVVSLRARVTEAVGQRDAAIQELQRARAKEEESAAATRTLADQLQAARARVAQVGEEAAEALREKDKRIAGLEAEITRLRAEIARLRSEADGQIAQLQAQVDQWHGEVGAR